MGPWGPKMGVPPKKAPILRKMPFPLFGPRRWTVALTTEVVV